MVAQITRQPAPSSLIPRRIRSEAVSSTMRIVRLPSFGAGRAGAGAAGAGAEPVIDGGVPGLRPGRRPTIIVLLRAIVFPGAGGAGAAGTGPVEVTGIRPRPTSPSMVFLTSSLRKLSRIPSPICRAMAAQAVASAQRSSTSTKRSFSRRPRTFRDLSGSTISIRARAGSRKSRSGFFCSTAATSSPASPMEWTVCPPSWAATEMEARTAPLETATRMTAMGTWRGIQVPDYPGSPGHSDRSGADLTRVTVACARRRHLSFPVVGVPRAGSWRIRTTSVSSSRARGRWTRGAR